MKLVRIFFSCFCYAFECFPFCKFIFNQDSSMPTMLLSRRHLSSTGRCFSLVFHIAVSSACIYFPSENTFLSILPLSSSRRKKPPRQRKADLSGFRKERLWPTPA